MTRLLKTLLTASLACSLLATPAMVSAQPAEGGAQGSPTKEELAAARRLFKEALALEKENEWQAALEKLETVGQVKMTPQVRFHLALCHEQLGRLVDAVNGFELAEQEAKAAGDKAASVYENAPIRAAAVRARVARLTLTVSGRHTTSEILLDGRPVKRALVGSELPMDPGEHRIQVRRGEEITFEEVLTFDEAQHRSLELPIDDPEVQPAPEPGPDPTPQPKPVIVPDDGSAQIPAYITAGVGAAALIGGGVFWGLRQSEIGTIRCDDPVEFTGCDPDDQAIEDTARTYDTTSKVLLGVGAAALATGVVLWFVLAPDGETPAATDGEAPADDAAASGPRIGVAPTGTGLQLLGTF